jgi:SEC-C motif-containing protein
MRCPCGSGLDDQGCCGTYLRGEASPPTAEALMRSRYTAYGRGDIDYIANTLAAEQRGAFDRAGAKAWATQAKWLGLRILRVVGGGPADREWVVEFIATYSQSGKMIEHHEVSQFRRGERGAWRLVSGDTSGSVADRRPRASPPQAASQSAAKIGRNDPCPCGSGRKYKKCCGGSHG